MVSVAADRRQCTEESRTPSGSIRKQPGLERTNERTKKKFFKAGKEPAEKQKQENNIYHHGEGEIIKPRRSWKKGGN